MVQRMQEGPLNTEPHRQKSIKEQIDLIKRRITELGREWIAKGGCEEIMKIVVTASGPDLDSPVDPRFGRSQYFIFVDPDSLQFEAIENERVIAPSGAGTQAAQFVASKGAEAVITGEVGPNASTTLGTAGIRIFLGTTGRVREAVHMFKSGRLQESLGFSGIGE